MKTLPRISGFTLVRNAEILDFPFRESVLSALPLCHEFIINCGDSEDETFSICEKLQKEFPQRIKIIRSIWNKENQSGGYQLKLHTDTALQACTSDWLFYIQADEVIHTEDHALIVKAIEKASQSPLIDGVVFDYLHFYGNYAYTCQGRNWYRREVRLFKNGRRIESFKDAQGFRKNGNRLKAVASGARIFHYGYVRNQNSLASKRQQMSQWWGEKPDDKPQGLQFYKPVGLTPFKGSHPPEMAEKTSNANHLLDPSLCPRKWTLKEIKNGLTLLWEKIVPFRIGEFRNYDLVRNPK